jgi:hypothetical protein
LFRRGRVLSAVLLCASAAGLALLGLTVNRLPDRAALRLRLDRISFPSTKTASPKSGLLSQATPDQDPDVDLVWSTQWFVPSSTDPNGGKDFHVYAESTSGGPLQCFVGENVDTRVNGGDTNETKSNPGSSSLLNTWD